MAKRFFLLFLVITMTACSTLKFKDKDSTIKKSPNDQKDYRSVTLSNGLPVLLISDPQSNKAAAAMDVSVGSADDPIDFEGLAHFLEHMLFLGTEKYPEAGSYQRFIKEHGGSHNAFTSSEHTNYFFDIDAQYLEGALDRFAQQFTAPLFNAEYVEREKNAVHSEFTAKIRDDGRRYFAALKEVLDEGHPYRKFSVGNLSTLADKENLSTRDALLQFYDKHYSAGVMRLVILGTENLDQLEALAIEKFSSIPNKEVASRNMPSPLISPDRLPLKLEIDSIRNKKSMTLAFPTPSGFAHQDSKPISYLANLLGHEGEGSLLSLLKREKLVNSLAAGAQFDTKTDAMMTIRMDLTPRGLENQDQILSHIFSFVSLLKQEGIKRLYFEEQQRLLDISFKFQEKSEPIHFVSALAGRLQDYAPKDVLHIGYELTNFNEALYREFLSHLRPDNMLKIVSYKGLESESVTPWYEGKYLISAVPQDLQTSLANVKPHPELSLPAKNTFIPESLEFEDIETAAKPQKLLEEPGLSLWYGADASFGTPKANLFITLRSPLANDNPANANKIEMMASLLKDELAEFTYPAYLAGLNYELYNHIRGITIKISGYSEKQGDFLQEILAAIQSIEFKQERFNIIKERLERGLQNAKEKKPYEQAIAKTQRLIMKPSWDEDQRLQSLKSIDLGSIQDYKTAFLSELDVAVMATGNINKDKALKITDALKSGVLRNSKSTRVERSRIKKLEGSTPWKSRFPVNHQDTAYILYLQGEEKSPAEIAKIRLLSQILSPSYYNEIRTEKQLGYIVFAVNYSLLEVPGMLFIVQSPSASGKEIENETIQFLNQYIAKLESLDGDKFAANKAAVITQLNKKENTIYERSNRFWRELDRENFNFDTREQLTSEIEKLTQGDLVSYYKTLLERKGNRISIYATPMDPEKDQASEAPMLDEQAFNSQGFF